MLRFEMISSQEIDKYVHSKRALIIDVRDGKSFERSHIENSINIPFEKLEKEYNKMPKDLILILYCERGGSSMLAAKELFDRGYVVKALIGGIKGYDGKYLVS
ncbi:MAG: rhodanese-like domain-containing protein [Butyrivibrio sp.]